MCIKKLLLLPIYYGMGKALAEKSKVMWRELIKHNNQS